MQASGGPIREDEFRIEILSWDWNLAVAISSKMTPLEQRFQGGLSYVRSFQLWGRVVEPEAYRAKTVRIWVPPFGPDIMFGPDEIDEVGRLYLSAPTENKSDWTLSLMLPGDAVTALARCLGTMTKYLFRANKFSAVVWTKGLGQKARQIGWAFGHTGRPS